MYQMWNSKFNLEAKNMYLLLLLQDEIRLEDVIRSWDSKLNNVWWKYMRKYVKEKEHFLVISKLNSVWWKYIWKCMWRYMWKRKNIEWLFLIGNNFRLLLMKLYLNVMILNWNEITLSDFIFLTVSIMIIINSFFLSPWILIDITQFPSAPMIRF